MDLEPEDLRSRYGVCRKAFVLTAVGILLLGASTAPVLLFRMTRLAAIAWVLRSRGYEWVLAAPIPWTTLMGSYLLWGRWGDLSWRRRAGPLVAMNAADALHWVLSHGDAFGLKVGALGHAWLRENVTMGFGWAEFILFASLAADVAAHLGADEAIDMGNKTRAFAGAGAVLWLITFLHLTDWGGGWPLRPVAVVPDHAQLLYMAADALIIVTSVHLAVLCLLAAHRCRLAVTDFTPKERGADLLKPHVSPDDDPWVRPDDRSTS